MKILIVEDEPKAGDYLRQGLRDAGFAVDLVTNGVDGLHHGLEGDHDLVILDVMLPGMDGWQVLKNLRSQGRQMPVLFLTARDQVEDRVVADGLGLVGSGHEQMVKPAAPRRLWGVQKERPSRQCWAALQHLQPVPQAPHRKSERQR